MLALWCAGQAFVRFSMCDKAESRSVSLLRLFSELKAIAGHPLRNLSLSSAKTPLTSGLLRASPPFAVGSARYVHDLLCRTSWSQRHHVAQSNAARRLLRNGGNRSVRFESGEHRSRMGGRKSLVKWTLSRSSGHPPIEQEYLRFASLDEAAVWTSRARARRWRARDSHLCEDRPMVALDVSCGAFELLHESDPM